MDVLHPGDFTTARGAIDIKNDLLEVPLPAIALLEERHYIVLEARRDDGFLMVVDPSLGRVAVAADVVLDDSGGSLLVLLCQVHGACAER